LKPIHRLIVLSATYRQSAADRPAARAVDPDNVRLWRWTPRRLEAEAIRDGMLAVSGLLDRRMYGPGTLDEAHRRRSVYFTIKRSQLVASQQLFDAPDALTGLSRRVTTTVAPQALLLLNGPQVRTYAEAFARRVRAASGEESVRQAYAWALGRAPRAEELAAARTFLGEQAASYGAAGKHAALVDLCQAIFALNEFVYLE
jgi:hypothetical protein